MKINERLVTYKKVLESLEEGNTLICKPLVIAAGSKYNSWEFEEFNLFWPEFTEFNQEEKIICMLLCIEMCEEND